MARSAGAFAPTDSIPFSDFRIGATHDHASLEDPMAAGHVGMPDDIAAFPAPATISIHDVASVIGRACTQPTEHAGRMSGPGRTPDGADALLLVAPVVSALRSVGERPELVGGADVG